MELYTMELMPRIKYEEIQEREGLLLQQAIASRHSVSTNTQSHISATKLLKNFEKTHHYIDIKNKIRVKILDYQNTYYELPEQYRTKQYKKEYNKMRNLSGIPWTVTHHNGKTIYTYKPEKELNGVKIDEDIYNRDPEWDFHSAEMGLFVRKLNETLPSYAIILTKDVDTNLIKKKGKEYIATKAKYNKGDIFIIHNKFLEKWGGKPKHQIYKDGKLLNPSNDTYTWYFENDILGRNQKDGIGFESHTCIIPCIGDVFANKENAFVIVDIDNAFMVTLRHKYVKNAEYHVPISMLYEIFYFRLKCYDYRPTKTPLRSLFLEYCFDRLKYVWKEGDSQLSGNPSDGLTYLERWSPCSLNFQLFLLKGNPQYYAKQIKICEKDLEDANKKFPKSKLQGRGDNPLITIGDVFRVNVIDYVVVGILPLGNIPYAKVMSQSYGYKRYSYVEVRILEYLARHDDEVEYIPSKRKIIELEKELIFYKYFGKNNLRYLENYLNLHGLYGTTEPFQIGDIVKLWDFLWDGKLYKVTKTIDRNFFVKELTNHFSETIKIDLDNFAMYEHATLQQLESCTI